MSAVSCTLTTDLSDLSTGVATDASSESSSGASSGSTTSKDGQVGLFEAGPTLPPYVASVLSDAPVAYYRFEEDSPSNTAKDEIAGHTATPDRQVGFGAAGIVGRGLSLDGKALLTVGDVFDFAGKVPFSFELWVKASANGGDQHLIHKRQEGTSTLLGYILYLGSDASVHFEDWGVALSAWTDTAVPPDFTHVVLTVGYAAGKGNSHLYINAQPAPHSGWDNVDDATDTTVPLLFGRGLEGTLDELAIYDKELSAERVLAHYRAARGL